MPLSVHPLSLGELELDHSFVVWQTNIGQKIWSPTTAWLVLGASSPILPRVNDRGAASHGAFASRTSWPRRRIA